MDKLVKQLKYTWKKDDPDIISKQIQWKLLTFSKKNKNKSVFK